MSIRRMEHEKGEWVALAELKAIKFKDQLYLCKKVACSESWINVFPTYEEFVNIQWDKATRVRIHEDSIFVIQFPLPAGIKLSPRLTRVTSLFFVLMQPNESPLLSLWFWIHMKQSAQRAFDRKAGYKLLTCMVSIEADMTGQNTHTARHGRVTKTVDWARDGVHVSISSHPGKVEALVNSVDIREEYALARQGVFHQFYLRKETDDTSAFMVYNDRDLAVATQEIRFLNWLRLNWRQRRTERRATLALAGHPRLGADSPLSLLDADILVIIAGFLY